MNRIGSSRGWSAYTKCNMKGGRSKEGALFIGNSDEVAEKINIKNVWFNQIIALHGCWRANHEVMKKV